MGKTEDWDRHGGEAPVHQSWGWPRPKVQRRKGTTQTLLLPTRSLKSRGKAKDINKWYGRWRDVSSGSDFPNLKAFLVFLHSKLSLSGRKEALYLHLKADFYLWPKVSLSTFNVKKTRTKKWTFQTWRTAMCSRLVVSCGHSASCIQRWRHDDSYSLSKTVRYIPFHIHMRMELGLSLQQLSSVDSFSAWSYWALVLHQDLTLLSLSNFQYYSDLCIVYSLCARTHPTSDYIITLENPWLRTQSTWVLVADLTVRFGVSQPLWAPVLLLENKEVGEKFWVQPGSDISSSWSFCCFVEIQKACLNASIQLLQTAFMSFCLSSPSLIKRSNGALLKNIFIFHFALAHRFYEIGTLKSSRNSLCVI